MNVIIQIECIALSFIYGLIIKLWSLFNYRLNIKKYLFRLLINLLWGFIVVILYIIIIYKINGGIFHIYFILSLLLGYIMSNKIVKLLENKFINQK